MTVGFLPGCSTGLEAPISEVWLWTASATQSSTGFDLTADMLGLTIHHLPLLVQPALGLVLPLQDDVVALQPAGEIVPRRGDHGVFSLEVLDDMLVGDLETVSAAANNRE